MALVWGGGAVSYSRHGVAWELLTEKGQPGVSYSGSIALHAVCLSFEMGVRLLPFSRRASPYIVWRPRLMLLRTVTRVMVNGMDMGKVQDWKWYPTAEGGLGIEVRLGNGQLFTELAVGLFPLYNDTVGIATSLSLVASLGYRYLFE